MAPSAPQLRFKRLSPDAYVPRKATPGSAGFDISSSETLTIPAGGQQLVKTGLKVMAPDNCYLRIAPRSGLALKHRVHVCAGVVDRDYRGEVGVVLENRHPTADFRVNKGDRIAQMIPEVILEPDLVEVAEDDETERGQGGFGSTGVVINQ